MTDSNRPDINSVREKKSVEDWYNVTNSPLQIQKLLERIKKYRIMLVLVQGGYQSGNTILVKIMPQHLLVDKPVDWPGSSEKIRVAFKDTAKLWNHFYSKLLSTEGNNLYLEWPTEVFQLQRRSYFRVKALQQSVVNFRHQDKVLADFLLVDLSAGGMKIGTLQKTALQPDNIIHDIIICIPPKDLFSEEIILNVGKGEILRHVSDKNKALSCFAVRFFPASSEEDKLIRYVRQRELEILRHGI